MGRRSTTQDHAEQSQDKARYFVLYPFTKTVEWYLMSREARQGMMNEHIRVGRTFTNISQISAVLDRAGRSGIHSRI